MMFFKNLELSNWRQYRNVKIDFHRNLTVITGANGAGKTTLLTLLNRHFGWSSNYVSTPKKKMGEQEVYSYTSDFWSNKKIELVQQSDNLGTIQHLLDIANSEFPDSSGSLASSVAMGHDGFSPERV